MRFVRGGQVHVPWITRRSAGRAGNPAANSLREHALEFTRLLPNMDAMNSFEKLGGSQEASRPPQAPAPSRVPGEFLLALQFSNRNIQELEACLNTRKQTSAIQSNRNILRGSGLCSSPQLFRGEAFAPPWPINGPSLHRASARCTRHNLERPAEVERSLPTPHPALTRHCVSSRKSRNSFKTNKVGPLYSILPEAVSNGDGKQQ
jgi:hypothetical protein